MTLALYKDLVAHHDFLWQPDGRVRSRYPMSPTNLLRIDLVAAHGFRVEDSGFVIAPQPWEFDRTADRVAAAEAKLGTDEISVDIAGDVLDRVWPKPRGTP